VSAFTGARWAVFAAALLAACSPAKSPSGPAAEPVAKTTEPAKVAPLHAAPAKPATAVPTGQGTPRLFGAPIDESAPEVALAALLEKPEPYAGKVIRTQGTVHRVCQTAGCWIELRDDSSGKTVRTPMAGHAFFLPKDSMGKRASVQGIVELRPLTAGHKEHLQGEGATETESLLSLSATGVALR
jgi:hypothetical protein